MGYKMCETLTEKRSGTWECSIISYIQIDKSPDYQVRLFFESQLTVEIHVPISKCRRKNNITSIQTLWYRSAFIVNHYFLSFSKISSDAPILISVNPKNWNWQKLELELTRIDHNLNWNKLVLTKID